MHRCRQSVVVKPTGRSFTLGSEPGRCDSDGACTHGTTTRTVRVHGRCWFGAQSVRFGWHTDGPAARTARDPVCMVGRVLGRCTVGAIRVVHGPSGFSDRPCTMHSHGQQTVRGWGPDRPCTTQIVGGQRAVRLLGSPVHRPSPGWHMHGWPELLTHPVPTTVIHPNQPLVCMR